MSYNLQFRAAKFTTYCGGKLNYPDIRELLQKKCESAVSEFRQSGLKGIEFLQGYSWQAFTLSHRLNDFFLFQLCNDEFGNCVDSLQR
jgi:hypothetical protein